MPNPLQRLKQLMHKTRQRRKGALDIEALPSEIRRLLLSTLDPASLLALIHASPAYYQQFQLDKRFILRSCLELALGKVAVDAHVVQLSSSRDFLSRRTQKVDQFLASYRDRRSASPASILREADVESLTKMLKFHVHVVMPLLSQYTRCAMDHLAVQTNIPRSADPQTPSRTEETRLMRALYRFELCCNVFGLGHLSHPFVGRPESMNEYVLQHLTAIFEPWELEEISCVHLFAQDKYNQVFDEIRDDLDRDNQRNGNGWSTPEGLDLDAHTLERTRLLKGTISRGLKLLHIVSQIHDHNTLVSVIDSEMVSLDIFIGDGLMEALSQVTQSRLWGLQPQSPRNVLVRQRAPMPFRGDQEAENAPSLSWVLLWGETYSNMFGGWTWQSLRRWGYVMWDARRIEQTGPQKLLMQWRHEIRKNGDPRDLAGLR
ncbi:hypothetical protein HFD88_000147 [Aspergillus terreus]|nr:hypothetical protein HFD88_000147 [Aspergillus terreus]